VTCSIPISAVVFCYLGKDVLQLPGLEDLTLFKILLVNIPANLVGVFLLSLYSNFRGKDLEKDSVLSINRSKLTGSNC
jgi:anaerobic C4-dicarboxylate transporter DcuB